MLEQATLSLTSAIDMIRWPTPRRGPLYPQQRHPVPIAQGAVWAPGQVWTGAENLDSTGIRSSYRPAHS